MNVRLKSTRSEAFLLLVSSLSYEYFDLDFDEKLPDLELPLSVVSSDFGDFVGSRLKELERRRVEDVGSVSRSLRTDPVSLEVEDELSCRPRGRLSSPLGCFFSFSAFLST